MPKNRKKTAAPVKAGPVLKAVAWCVFIGLAGVGYVWQKNQIHELGEEMKKQERKLADLKQKNNERMKILAGLRSPAYLEDRIRSLQLGLGMPSPRQVITLSDQPGPMPPPGQSNPSVNATYARPRGVVQQARKQ
ncbi:MAG: hypothetical protein CMO80_09055 [Verrucomicrobiales bacterium]|nr:hypothetical protein [Verrucomicrobiales bacterium]|tara:strand:- start:5324 stop:5728 length:405 start_codon:yes stop_codon:yes gene_type:complete